MARCAFRAAYQRRNGMPKSDRSARWYAGGNIAARCPYLRIFSPSIGGSARRTGSRWMNGMRVIERSDSLNPPAWTLGQVIAGNVSLQVFSDPNLNRQQRYDRAGGPNGTPLLWHRMVSMLRTVEH